MTIGRVSTGVEGSNRDRKRLGLNLNDGWVSSTHAHLRKALGRWVIEDAGSRNGTLVNGSPVQNAALVDGDVIEVGRTFLLFRAAVAASKNEPEDIEVSGSPDGPELATLCASLDGDLSDLKQVAGAGVSVLIQGETGTGKEVVARALHALSGRAGAFVAVNCGALPDALVESELFGYRKGAFSEAREDRPGLIRSAHRGTLFLDEIGDLPLSSQPALLRVLQEREVLPVGATQPVGVDLRVCAASHLFLEKLVQEGRLREDLFGRLAGFSLRLPPLRQRIEDMGLLVRALIRRFARRPETVSFRREAGRALFRYSWPRNIRELEKSLEAAVALAGDEPVDLSHLPKLLRSTARPSEEPAPSAADGRTGRESATDADRRAELTRLLTEHEGNISAVARSLGKERVQVRRWLKRYGLDPTRFGPR